MLRQQLRLTPVAGGSATAAALLLPYYVFAIAPTSKVLACLATCTSIMLWPVNIDLP